jgi:phosphopantetheinyl transferase
MPKSFYIGLSWMSSAKRTAEGRRIVSLLSANSGELGEILYEEGGRPYFAGQNGADFNISHSRKMIAASFLLSGRTGCDIQYVDPNRSCVEISRRFFHAGEQAYIENDPQTRIRNFYRIWVLKEAWIKLHGFSVFDMAKTPAFSIGDKTGTDKTGSDYFLYELSSPSESYMLAVVRQDCSDEPEIRWFSDTTLALNKVENIYAAQSPENTVIPNI